MPFTLRSDGARSTAIYALRQRRSRPAATSGDQRRQQPITQPREPLTERDLLQFTLRQRAADQRRPAATTADNVTARASNGARSIAIYTKTAPQSTSGDQRRQQPTTQPPEPLTERDLLPFTLRSDGARSTAIYALRQRHSRPAATSGDQRRQQPTTQPPDSLTERDLLQITLTERDLLQFTLRQRRSRPAATTADNGTGRASNGVRSIAIYTKTAQQPTDLLQFTLRQRRSRPAATTADNATARASADRSIAIYTKTAPQPTSGDQRRQRPTTQSPEPLTERDLLQFTLRQRRSRPAATSGDNSRQRNRQSLSRARSILQFTLRQRRGRPPDPLTERDLLQFTLRQRRSRPAATSGDNSRQRNRQSLSRSEIYCNLH